MYGCKGNDVILNKVHCRALRAVHQDFSSSFKQLLEKNASVPINVHNLSFLLAEIYKIINRVS